MDSAVNTPASEKKKPFAIASITLLLGAFFVLWQALFPVLRRLIAPNVPAEALIRFSELATFAFIILCILSVAVATFFKKSNIFLIVSLFALALAYAIPSISCLKGFFLSLGDEFTSLFTFEYGLYSGAYVCFVLGFLVLGLTAIFARMGKVKLTNLWILGTVLFVIAALCSMINAFRTVIVNFEQLGWALEMWLDYGIGDTSNIVVDFFYRLGMPWIFFGSAVMHFVSSILMGLYLKKLAK